MERSPLTYTSRGGRDIPVREGNWLAKLKGAPVATPWGSILLDRPAEEYKDLPATLQHEGEGHIEGRGALYDLKEKLPPWLGGSGYRNITSDPQRGLPSEIYAYSSQPAKYSAEDMQAYLDLMDKNPEFRATFEKYKNPKSDWSFEGMKSSRQATEELLRKRKEAQLSQSGGLKKLAGVKDPSLNQP